MKQSGKAAAAAVIEIDGARVLAASGTRGLDPATTLARPGSTVKPLLYWTAAETGALDATETIHCDGTYPGGYRCPGVHGDPDLPDALATSCNVFGYAIASRLDLKRIRQGFVSFGLTRPTGLETPEGIGFVADEDSIASLGLKNGTRWELVIGIGHGPIEVTPLQLAAAYLELLRRLRDQSSPVDEGVRRAILEGLSAAVSSEHGTGKQASVQGVAVAGKTGTAEGGRIRETNEGVPENGWFVGFAPRVEPTLVVATLVGGGAGKDAAELTGDIWSRLL